MRAIRNNDPLGGARKWLACLDGQGERGQQAEIGARPLNRWSRCLLSWSQSPERPLYLVLQSLLPGIWETPPGRVSDRHRRSATMRPARLRAVGRWANYARQ
jgi:hypothetical protein